MSDVSTKDSQAGAESGQFTHQAIDWYVKLISQHPPGLSEDFDRWLASDERHGRAFARVMATSRLLDSAVNAPELVVLRRDALEAARRAARARWQDKLTKRFWSWRSAVAAAAVLMIVVLTGWWTLEGMHTARYATAGGQRMEVQLDDGSRMWLDESTELTVDFDAHRRRVNLIGGQARFEVATERSRAFEVTAGDRSIVAVGTVFNVDLLQSRLYVTLLEGRLLVSQMGGNRTGSPARTIELHPAQQLVAMPGTATHVRAEVNLTETVAWEKGQISFEDEPLEPAVARVNRYAKRKVVIADPRLNELRVSGVFNAGDSAAFADALATLLPIVVTVDSEDKIILNKTE